MAVRLFKQGKASSVVASSGIAYVARDGRRRTEADDMSEIMSDMGVPSAAVLKEDKSRTTEESAEFCASILHQHNWRKVLLVSSAHHLPRAVFWFAKEGFEVVPVASGLSVRRSGYGLRDYLPSAKALQRSTAALKEYLGLATARLAGC
jgi:uncharacterized SAM-binding protein YcdF (DUF218 family)